MSEELIAKWLDDRASLTEEEVLALERALAADPGLAAQVKDQLAVAELLSRGKAVDRANFESQIAQRIAGGGAAFMQSTLDMVKSRERRRVSWKEAAVAAALILGLLVLLLRHEPPVVTPAVAPKPAGSGLRGEYYPNGFLKNEATVRVDPKLDFTWRPSAGPLTGWGSEFSARWTGKLHVPAAGVYKFRAEFDDGLRVRLQGTSLFDSWEGRYTVAEASAERMLDAGVVDLQVEYFNGGGLGVLRLYWTRPGQPEEIIPSSALSPE